jgi:hypothetical protein
MTSPLFDKWSQSIQLQHNLYFENELYVACLLLQGASEGVAERGTERHNLNSIYWNDTHETISFAALGSALGCTYTTGIILSNPAFWEAFDEFVVTGAIEPLEAFEEKLLEFYTSTSTFYKLLHSEEVQADTTQQEESSGQLPVQEEAVQETDVQTGEPAQQPIKRRTFHQTKRIHGRRAITPIRSGRHKTPKNHKNKSNK